MADTKGRVLAGRYEIQGVVGEGGMAKVFRGTDRVLGRTVAVKVLAPQFARDGQFVERFRREAQASAGLNHPNIVSVFDTGSDGGVHFIVMEFLEGRTLREVLRDDGPLHPRRAAEVTEQVCRALSAAHHKGLVHRDVKPGNIMLLPSGEVKVMDFGIARATSGEALTQTATVLGTASYFSPEQAKGEPVDARSDVYSVGCVLYEIMTRRPPFEGDSPVAVAYKHVREDPVLPRTMNSDIPQPLEAVTMKALAKNPANRYQSATEMADDLSRAMHGQPVAATPILAGDATQVVSRPVGEGTAVLPAVPPDEDERASRTWLVALITILVVGLVGTAAFLLVRELTKSAPTVGVPKLVGLQEREARALLERRGFRVEVTRGPHERKEGVVYDQQPAPDEQVPEGSQVTIFVSTGPEPVSVPDLTGKTIDEARADLEAVGLTLGGITEEGNDEVEAGRIISQDPPAESEKKPGSEVDVVVSKGRTTAFVPNVRCFDPEEARELVKDQGLKFKQGGEEDSAACPPGTVARTDPEGGTEVEAGSTVTWFESTGPEETIPPTPTVPISPTLPVTPTP